MKFKKDVWTYNLIQVKKFPRLRKILHPKIKYADADGNKFTSLEAARRLYKSFPQYRKRVNKPTIRIVVKK